jgi:hypothetical protein
MNGTQSEPGYSARRKAGRLRLRLPAYAITHKSTLRVVLCDLSQSGAKVFCKADLARGRDLVLRWGNHEAFGTVKWEREGFRGLEFDEPVTVAVLTDTRDWQDAQGMTRTQVNQWIAETGWAFGKDLT